MQISEIFHSLQGEGVLAGVPSVFVRTAGCPNRCAWCDTSYAWDPASGDTLTIGEILAGVRRYECRHVVLTGGEPMAADGVRELAHALCATDAHLTLETSGVLPPDGVRCDLVSLSPKLGSAAATYIPDPGILDDWLSAADYQIKVVMDTPQDVAELRALLGSLRHSVPPTKVLLMPRGATSRDVDERAPWVAELCKTHGYRFCDRLHLRLFGAQRGV